jgi:hypothetical protein
MAVEIAMLPPDAGSAGIRREGDLDLALARRRFRAAVGGR